jgi:four helix bundle protein
MHMSSETVLSYKELIVWQRAMELVDAIYALTKVFPKEELFGLTLQMRRAAVSIPSNIAEGRHRNSRKDFAQFLTIAYGSSAELETQLAIAKKQSYAPNVSFDKSEALLSEVMKMLNTMLSRLRFKS